jgi:PAS domain S-box-containing protein
MFIHPDISRTGILWIGTRGGGLNRFDSDKNQFTYYYHQPGNPNSLIYDTLNCFHQDCHGVYWIGARGGGLSRMTLLKGDHDNNSNNAAFINYTHHPGDPSGLSDNHIRDIYEDRSGVLWIGTQNGGLSYFDRASNQFFHYQHNPQNPNGISHNFVLCICEDRQGDLWIGTAYGGLNRLDRSRKHFTLFTEKHGLPNNVVIGILEDDKGNLWLSTNRGLSCFNPRSKQFKNYDQSDGLQSSEFNYNSFYKAKDGEMFFGGINGFNAFYPGNIKENPYIPPLVITDFKLFNKSVPVGRKVNNRIILKKCITEIDTLELSHRDNVFSFQFAALNYISPGKNQYAYIMEDFEEEWNYVGNRRFAGYINLPSGEYTFRVKGSNNDGVWNEEGISLKIKVLPPFWATWWFRISLFILLVFMVFLFRRVRTRLVLRRNQELEDMVASRTIALREAGEKYRTVVERAHTGIAIVQAGVIIFQNARFAKLLGCDEKDMIDRPLMQFVAPGKQSQVNDFLADSGSEKKLSGDFETTLRHQDGQDIYVEINWGKITYRKQPALLMFFHDIHMHKLLAEERMKTAKLESTSILAGGIAHDFNNLLTIILGNIQLALVDKTPGEQHKRLEEAEKSSMKAAELIRQFLTLSKFSTLFKKTEFLQGIIRDAVHSVLQGSGVKCHFRLQEDLWPVDCDVHQIKQAIKNIAINAKQAMSNNGVLEVKAQNEELAADQISDKNTGKYVYLSIKDNGIGIPRKDLPKIYDPYFSTRQDVTRKGLGLGLSLVHAIIIKHNGTINVTSEIGTGTTVRIYLPISKKLI